MAVSSEVSAVQGVVAVPSRSESSMASPDPGFPDAISASISPLRATEFSPVHATTQVESSEVYSDARAGVKRASLQRQAAMGQPAPKAVTQSMSSFFAGAPAHAGAPMGLPRPISSANTAGNFGNTNFAPVPPTLASPALHVAAQPQNGRPLTGVGTERNIPQKISARGAYQPAYYVPQDEPVTELRPDQQPSLGMTPTYLTSQVRAFETRPGMQAGSSIVLMPPPGTTLKDHLLSKGVRDCNSDSFGGNGGRSRSRHRHRHRHLGRDRRLLGKSEQSREGERRGHRRSPSHGRSHRRGENDPDYFRDTHHQRQYTGPLTNSDDWDSTKERVECRCKCSHCRKGDGRCSYAEGKRGHRSRDVGSSSSSSSSTSWTSSMSSSSISSSSSYSHSTGKEQVRRAPRGSSSRNDKSPSRSQKKANHHGPESGIRGDLLKSHTPSRKNSGGSPIDARDRNMEASHRQKGKNEDNSRRESRRSGVRHQSEMTSKSSVVSGEGKFFPPQLTHHYFHHYPSLPSKKTNPFPQQGTVPLRREGFQMPEGNVNTIHHFPMTQKGAAEYKTGYPANPATHRQPFDNFRIATFEIPESEHEMQQHPDLMLMGGTAV